MPFTAAKIALFFKDQVYMALTHRTATTLATEGIAIPDNLPDFDKEGMDSIYCNLRKPTKVLCAGAAGVCMFLASGYGWVTVMHMRYHSLVSNPLTSLPYPRAQ
jgi:hypothetical protein